MNDCKLSIIIPHFNIPDLLQKLLDSIPEREEIQVIVVDDTSTKNLERLDTVMRNGRARGVEFFRNETGKNSAGTCRNIGLDHARGKWILFADADDYFVDGWYDIVTKYFDSDYDAVYFTPISVIEKTGEPTDRHINYLKRQKAFAEDPCKTNDLVLRYDYYVVWSILFRRTFIEDNQIRFQSVKYANDVMFSTLCGYKMRKFICPMETIYCLTLRENSLWTGKNAESANTRKIVELQRLEFLFAHLSSDEIHLLGTFRGDFAPLLTLLGWRTDQLCDKQAYIRYLRKMRAKKMHLVNWGFVLRHPIITCSAFFRKLQKSKKG